MRQHRIQTRCASALALLPALLLSPLVASAVSISESESNDTFATADGVSGGSHSLLGAINPNQDMDIFRFSSLVAGSSFSASVAGITTTSGIFDISMVLFDSTGHAWSGNDGTGGSISFTITNADTYYLAVSSWQNEAMDMFGNFLRDDFFWTDANTTGTTFAGWSNQAFGSGSYDLSVSSVSAVPVPAAAWLLGSGLAGLVGVARRRNGTA